jgi:uncharacterized protein
MGIGTVLADCLYLFVIFSLAGWILEFMFRSLRLKKFTNPGLLRGPYLPIYGIGAVFIYLVSRQLSGSSLLIRIFAYFVITTGIEFITGFFFEKFFQVRLWDYSAEPLRWKNYICLKFSIYWVILAVAAEFLFIPAAMYFYDSIPRILFLAAGVALTIFIEFAWKFKNLFAARKCENKAVDDQQLHEFYRILQPLLMHPEVAKLARYRHHRAITRLDHSLEVAGLSYALAKRLYLDGASAARGGLLHDLFYYEWLNGGPTLHGFRHPRICLANARKIIVLSEKEEDIISKHMWPLTFLPPRYMESWIVCFVDTYCTVKDYIAFTRTINRFP